MKKISRSFKKTIAHSAIITALLGWFPAAQANLQLQSASVIVEQSEGEGSMLVQNMADSSMLMHVDVLNVDGDDEDLILIAPAITRIEGGDTQLVRFILKESKPLKTERFKRATFEGIPKASPNSTQFSIRQNIGLIIRPANLPPNNAPWKLLKWRHTTQGLTVENPSPYVVRMLEEIKVLPSGITLSLLKNYLLPGEILTLPSEKKLTAVNKVSFYPASINGFIVGAQEASVDTQ